jgi:ubiquinone/menaquinone biosynthesis C-methylase UbiE
MGPNQREIKRRLRVLKHAEKIGNHRICILADVCQLPFVDDCFDGVISGYTVQHIHKDRQPGSLQERFRVPKPGNHLCVMTSQETGFAHRVALKMRTLLGSLVFDTKVDPESVMALEESSAVNPPDFMDTVEISSGGKFSRIQ